MTALGSERRKTTGGSPLLLRLAREDGANLHVEVSGPSQPSPPAIVVLDGIGCTGWAFRRILPRWTERHRVLTMHYRGHGRSPTPPKPWHVSMPTLADDAAAACALAAIEPSLVVGFSMGFQIALELFRRHQAYVAGLVSISGPPGRVLSQFQGTGLFGHTLPFALALSRYARSLTHKFWQDFVPSRVSRIVGLRTQVNAERIRLDDFEFYLTQMAAINPEFFLEMLSESHRHSADDVLADIDVPTLVLAGGRDSFVPLEVLRDMAFRISNAKWQVFSDATHALPAEFPDEVAEAVLTLASEIGASKPPGPTPQDALSSLRRPRPA